LSVAWDEWADANGIPTNDYDERQDWEAVNAAMYVGAYADAVAAGDRLLADQQTVLRLLSSFGMWRTPICLDDLLKLDRPDGRPTS
jgi:hypothetical protein